MCLMGKAWKHSFTGNLILPGIFPYHTFTIPYHTIPLPYHTIPYHTIPLPYHTFTIPYHTLHNTHTIPYHTIPYLTQYTYHIIPYHTYHTISQRRRPHCCWGIRRCSGKAIRQTRMWADSRRVTSYKHIAHPAIMVQPHHALAGAR